MAGWFFLKWLEMNNILQIPRTDKDLWSSKFAECQKLADILEVTDFCLTQSSLEETFLRIANEDDATDSTNTL